MTKEELEKTHPDYAAFKAEWLFHIRSYLGGKFYRDGDYLLQHPFESAGNYKRRKEIAYYYNYCQPIVDIFVSYLYKKPPERSYNGLSPEVVPPHQPITLFDAFWWNCDFEGTSYDQFMRHAQRLAGVYGRVSIIVDKPATTARTKAEAMAKRIYPYLALITPENLLDWEYARLDTGRPTLVMAKIKETRNTYRIWTPAGWKLYETNDNSDEAKFLSSGEYTLGEIPLVTLYNKRSDIRMIGISDIQDIADINKNIYYFCSDAKEIIENTAFPMLALPYEKGGDEKKPAGPRNILEFDPERPAAIPFWLEAPHTSLAEIRAWIQQDAQEITRIALMGGLRNVETSVQPWSGASIEVQAQQLYAVLIDKADNAERAELEILRLWAKWEGEEFTGNVKYQRDFATRDLTTALQNAITAGTERINSLTFEKARQKKIVSATLPELEEADRETIYKEIEALKELPTPKADPGLPAQNMGA